MNSDPNSSHSGLELAAEDVGTYGMVAYGAGYLLVVLSIGALSLDKSLNVGAWLMWGSSSFFLFLAWFTALIFAGQIISRAGDIQKEIKRLRAGSLPVTAFSMCILFLGLSGMILHSIRTENFGVSGNVALLFPSILSVAGAIFLMMGVQVYSKELAESKFVGGIFILISIILLYFISLTPWRQFWSLMEVSFLGYIFPPLPPLPGPLLCESNIETAALLLTSVCGLLFAIPALREGSSRSFGKILVSAIEILFSAGLMYFNFSVLSWIIALPSPPASLWIMLFGALILSISGIIILISGCLSIAGSIKEISERLTPSSKRKDIKFCPNCGSEIPLEARYCPKCGKEAAIS